MICCIHCSCSFDINMVLPVVFAIDGLYLESFCSRVRNINGTYRGTPCDLWPFNYASAMWDHIYTVLKVVSLIVLNTFLVSELCVWSCNGDLKEYNCPRVTHCMGICYISFMLSGAFHSQFRGSTGQTDGRKACVMHSFKPCRL